MKVFGAVLLLVFLLLVVAGAGFGWYVYNGSEAVIDGEYALQVAKVDVPDDSASVAHGRHLAVTRGCAGCHGEALGGMISDLEPLGTFAGSNLTPGRGGIGEEYRDVDWVRAIRHGVGLKRNLLLMMPSEEYFHLSDRDLGSLIAYLNQLPPVDRELPSSQIGPVGRMLVEFEAMTTLVSARYIDHTAPRPAAPEPGRTAEYGEYLAVSCVGCHGADMAGGVSRGPQAPKATNINPLGLKAMNYTLPSFHDAMRTGRKPNGTMMDSSMPYERYGQMTDEELEAIWLYLNQLPAVPASS